MLPGARFVCCILLLLCLDLRGVAGEPPDAKPTARILSWNVSSDAFVARPEEFTSILAWADPDIVLLDEVGPATDLAPLTSALASVRSDGGGWRLSVGRSGGRQRCVVASRGMHEPVPELADIVPYPDVDRSYILQHMSAAERANTAWSMEHGIPVNGAIVTTRGGRLLVVIADLQCCGSSVRSWQEYRRRVEAREIRRRVSQVLTHIAVDGMVIAGDFNLVQGPEVLQILQAPYADSLAELAVAEPVHPDGVASWTWDGRGTPFPSGRLDYQLFDPASLSVRSALVLDTESAQDADLARVGLDVHASATTGRHRPLVIEYAWH